MKVHIPEVKKIAGPHIFCNRLREAFSKYVPEVELVGNLECDIHLHNIVSGISRKGAINILRLDGVYFDKTTDYKKKNESIKFAYDRADGIVFQSHFSKELCQHYLGKTRVLCDVIRNGIFVEEQEEIFLSKRPYFMAVANWRPFKRLRETIDSFLLSNLHNVDLYVFGNVKNAHRYNIEITHPNVRYMGVLDPKLLIPYYRGSLGLIHLSWLDNCPNSVVEALGNMIPVICGNNTGTKEIVHLCNGIVLNIDKETNLSPLDVNNPPPIDTFLVAQSIKKVCDDPPKINNHFVDMRNIARQYYNFFKEFV